ncbi:MAG: GNAT family N-acetyltransferase [Spirosomataceae bacterium]
MVKNHPKKGLEGANPVEIERFYIQKAYKGQRLGSTLMQACVDWAKKEGFDTLWLGVWEYNPKAINFYEKMGFHRFGTHTFTLGSDIQLDFLMKRTLK